MKEIMKKYNFVKFTGKYFKRGNGIAITKNGIYLPHQTFLDLKKPEGVYVYHDLVNKGVKIDSTRSEDSFKVKTYHHGKFEYHLIFNRQFGRIMPKGRYNKVEAGLYQFTS